MVLHAPPRFSERRKDDSTIVVAAPSASAGICQALRACYGVARLPADLETVMTRLK